MSTITETQDIEESLLASLMSDDCFWPSDPRSIEETGLGISFVESLILKYLHVTGTSSGRGIGAKLCLPFGLLETILGTLRARQIIVHAGAWSGGAPSR